MAIQLQNDFLQSKLPLRQMPNQKSRAKQISFLVYSCWIAVGLYWGVGGKGKGKGSKVNGYAVQR